MSLAGTLSDSGLSPVGHGKTLLGAVTLREPSKSPSCRCLWEAAAGDGSPAAWCPWLDDIHGIPPGQL